MEKLKKVAKYTTNVLAIVSALIAGINGVVGTYLLGQKVIKEEK